MHRCFEYFCVFLLFFFTHVTNGDQVPVNKRIKKKKQDNVVQHCHHWLFRLRILRIACCSFVITDNFFFLSNEIHEYLWLSSKLYIIPACSILNWPNKGLRISRNSSSLDVALRRPADSSDCSVEQTNVSNAGKKWDIYEYNVYTLQSHTHWNTRSPLT